MRKFSCLMIAIALFVFAGCGKSDSSPSVNAGAPTKEAAVQVLRSLLTALEAKDYDKAATLVYIPPQMPPDDIKKGLGRILELQELSAPGIDILVEKGKWGKLAEVYGADRANRFVERSKVPVDECYGLNYEGAEAGFYWDGKQFKIIRVDDIGKLR